jgi:hypothetical protein
MAIHEPNDPRRDPIGEPGRKHGDRVPEVIDPPDPRRHDPPGPDSPRQPVRAGQRKFPRKRSGNSLNSSPQY